MYNNIEIDSEYLLSIDLLHDNSDKNIFLQHNVYNLNNINNNKEIEFKIRKINIDSNETYEDHVKNIMLSNFSHKHYNIKYEYNTINENIKAKIENEYTIICDNMQCTFNNIINIKMLLNNARINVYIPFILCCEHQSKDNTNKILKSYDAIVDKLKDNRLYNNNLFEILPCDFFDISGNLLENYILESNLIGYNYLSGELLNFKEIKDISNIKKFIEKFKDFIETIQNKKLSKIMNKIMKDINIIIKLKYKINEKNESYCRLKTLVYSMKEMRDWHYVKEIVNKTREKYINFNSIYCTSDSINLFRAVLYNISSINISRGHLKYISLVQYENNNEKIIYKQISPSYYFIVDNLNLRNIKTNIYNNIMNINSNIVEKIVIINDISNNNNLSGGIYKPNFYIKNINLDYNNIRFELFKNHNNLLLSIRNIICDMDEYIDKIINNKINKDIKKNLRKIYDGINDLYSFTKLYDYNIIIDIDYKCKKIDKLELYNLLDYCNNLLYDDEEYCIDYYKKKLDFIHYRYISDYDKIISKLKNNKFYLNDNKILDNYELYISSLLGDIIRCSININEREKFGYFIKIILNDYDYSLFRNSMRYLYDDEKIYNDLIKNKRKLVKTFNEELFDYEEKIISNPNYDNKLDIIKIEELEDKKYKSYYDIIIKLLD